MTAVRCARVALLGVSLLAGCGEERVPVTTSVREKGVEYPDSVWEPGEPVPGWEDGDCSGLLDGADSVDWSPPTASLVFGQFVGSRVNLELVVNDCVEFDCGSGTEGLPSWETGIDAEYIETALRGVGYYSSGVDGLYVHFQASAPSGWVQVLNFEDWYNNGELQICVDRFQPDLISLTAVATLVDGVAGLDSAWAPYLRFGGQVSVTFADHSGYSYEAGGPIQSWDDPFWIYATTSYDDAWPWDQITDPAVREEVYWRYLPYNLMEEE